MLNKLYSRIGHFFLTRSGYYLEDEEDCKASEPYDYSHINPANPRNTNKVGMTPSSSRGSIQTPNKEPSYTLRIYPASGGRVIECFSLTNTNNHYTENIELYVIPEGADLVDELGKVLMLHSLAK
tara:strand:- start:353 stop:727 length:375 start_codon:yes stop_codon:yes gene_type:complete